MSEKLYPSKCAKCGQFISNDDFEDDRVNFKHNYYNFGGLNIWHEHDYNCKKILKEYEG